jgi:hypothetical protein
VEFLTAQSRFMTAGTWCSLKTNRCLESSSRPTTSHLTGQIHLDLWVDDVEAAHNEVTSLGAKLLKVAEEVTPEAVDNYQVYADPAGHPFCICWVIKQ